MTVILILFTFAVFILIDYWLAYKEAQGMAVATVVAEPPVQVEPAFVEGFLVPEGVRYHPGHGWLAAERPHLATVGMDEFAASLAGKVDRIELPRPGTWIRQGQKAWKLFRNGQMVEMVSPTEGEVLEVNPEAIGDPSLVRKDPYGRGWLMRVHVPDEEGTTRNLIPKSLVRGWMHDAAQRLYALQPQMAGAVAAEGGRPVEDIATALGAEGWKQLTAGFFLTE
jgi:glycine cleavage system H lipoate-binding protein